MKKIIILIVFVLALGNFTFAQTPLVELNKVKEIKLLESNREDVRKILADYNLDISDDNGHYEWFSTKNAYIMISYSSGKCFDNSDDWNVPEWKVTEIKVSPKNAIQIKNIGIDYSKFRKEREYRNVSQSYVYHNKDLGIAFEVIKSEVKTVYLSPPKENFSLLCDNEVTKKFYSSESWFDNKLKERFYIDEPPNLNADVVNLILGASEIYETCPFPNSTKTESCPASVNAITVLTIAKDPENDVLTYDYKVSGGKIVGRGANVIWDLSGVKAGTYTITAAVDDSCGLCGKSITKTVVVKECPNCRIK